jgi:hypothetical protein
MIINETHALNTSTNATFAVDADFVNNTIFSTITTLKTPILPTTTIKYPTTIVTFPPIIPTTTIQTPPANTPTTTFPAIQTTSTLKKYESANRVTPMPTPEQKTDLIEQIKTHAEQNPLLIAGAISAIIIIIIAILWLLGDYDEDPVEE